MAAVLHYFDGRGLGEGVRIALCAANIPFTEVIYTKREQMVALIENKKLQFDQLPLLEIDGLNLVQSAATKTYIAQKGGLLTDDVKTNTRINILHEGCRDFLRAYLGMGFSDDEVMCKQIKETVLPKYLPIFDKILQDNGTGYLVGDKLTLADVGLYEVLLATIDYFGTEAFNDYQQIKHFLDLMNSTKEMELYLTKYRKRKNDEKYVNTIEHVLKKTYRMK